MKQKQFSRDEFKAQCLLIGIALKEAPNMPLEDIAEKFAILHYGEKEYAEARIAVRGILGLDPPPAPVSDVRDNPISNPMVIPEPTL